MFALLIGLSAASLFAADDVGARIDDLIHREMTRQKIPGVAIAVVQHGEVLVARGYGLANVEQDVPVDQNTIFQSGSVGKQFTAVLITLLIEDGKIALEDSVTKYFPEAPESWRSITVHHLLTHTSGIPNYESADFDLQRNYTELELIRRATSLKPQFAAGARWSYSNTGYMLLGLLVKRVTGQFYGDVLRDRIFNPIGMKTAQVISDTDIVPRRASGYQLVDGALKNQAWVSPILNTTADGCLYFSLNDLLAWDQAWRSQAVLKPESWAMVKTPVHLNSGRTYPYGFGINLFDENGQTVERHSGAWQGFKAFRARYVGDDFSVLVLANLAQAMPDRIGDGIAAFFKSKRDASPEPVPKENLAVTLRLTRLLGEARDGKLKPEELAYVDIEYFSAVAPRLVKRLAGIGSLRQLKLTESIELGDDMIYRYEAAFGDQKLIVRIGIAPDDKVSTFVIN
ncbi:MAG: beta-lactamase family protein [Undibacterium sp.]|nr:beta-lactamase family protein [Opitutaceae bacterium]